MTCPSPDPYGAPVPPLAPQAGEHSSDRGRAVDLTARGSLPYETIEKGVFAEAELTVALVPQSMARNSHTTLLIEDAWLNRRACAERVGYPLYSRPLCRLVAWEREGRTLRVVAGRTNYKESVGTNHSYPEIGRIYGEAYLANAIGICCVVQTVDRHLLVQERNDRVDRFPGAFHVCGGNLERPTGNGVRAVNAFAAMRQELWEELYVEAKIISEMHCLGLVQDRRTRKPELIFAASLLEPVSAVLPRCGAEHDRLITCATEPDGLAAFLVAEYDRIVPVGLASLMAFGEHEFGPMWCQELVERLGIASGTEGRADRDRE